MTKKEKYVVITGQPTWFESPYSVTTYANKARDYLVRGGKDPFSEFRDGLVVPRGDSGRSSEYNELSYIDMESSDYTMSISDEYEAFIKKLLNIKEDSW